MYLFLALDTDFFFLGLRLLRYIFGAWLNLIVDIRGEGRNSSFRCLNHFVDNDGHLAPFMPIGRIRKCELDIKQNEKVGSGTFADVFRCELKIPCAAKRLKGNAGQKELVEFVREGEMLRKVTYLYTREIDRSRDADRKSMLVLHHILESLRKFSCVQCNHANTSERS